MKQRGLLLLLKNKQGGGACAAAHARSLPRASLSRLPRTCSPHTTRPQLAPVLRPRSLAGACVAAVCSTSSRLRLLQAAPPAGSRPIQLRRVALAPASPGFRARAHPRLLAGSPPSARPQRCCYRARATRGCLRQVRQLLDTIADESVQWVLAGYKQLV